MVQDHKQVRSRKVPFAKIAYETFGYDQLHPGQQEALQAVFSGHDTLAVLPTGSGKSFIYQCAGHLLKGATVVVSPLIALQRDQVENIEELNIGNAALINSVERDVEASTILEDLEEGDLEFLFLAPEQFNNAETLERLCQIQPSLFVIDEAHCISEWGHDFRPEYLRLGSIIEELGHPRVLALTATAAPPVREEILERLHMQDTKVIVQGFDRPNIWLSVERFQDERTKKKALIERVQENAKPGIIYAATRKHTEEVAEALQAVGIKAAFYHAGMKGEERTQVQSDFMEDRVEVIVATTAFGMGVDKPNVRFVYHYDISDSVDSYYQEIGRAGRDGEAARAILFYSPRDLNIRYFLSGRSPVDAEEVELVAETIQEQPGPITTKELSEALHLSQTKTMQILTALEELNVIETLSTGEVVANPEYIEHHQAIEEAIHIDEARRQHDRSRIEMIRGYAELHDCQREYMLNYFGEVFEGPCQNCANCDAGIVTTNIPVEQQPFPINSRVRHTSWGPGLVMRYEEDKIIVLFDEVGYKALSLTVVQENNLLESLVSA
ncbi:ATP-dependent DNA helicase RecQ [Ktedonobacter sp. SOSP1-52]|uniref:RecQ family ATP-dependent DNA helicase n=1 Tax=Ktedonobacter sp. SOSP1-52 TaxID=2778366 RepID=UPI0019154931|nr:RecQ family ATP-dependent DNA helicase [Ktedonobacter sp. SOSP1-52]GHO65304.1 ATP-dependent DNA helicase RecQ [Ktedonobacter sp. SOSP1-52]